MKWQYINIGDFELFFNCWVSFYFSSPFLSTVYLSHGHDDNVWEHDMLLSAPTCTFLWDLLLLIFKRRDTNGY